MILWAYNTQVNIDKKLFTIKRSINITKLDFLTWITKGKKSLVKIIEKIT